MYLDTRIIYSMYKKHFCHSVNQALRERVPLVDVDGSYLYRKQQQLIEADEIVVPLPCPSPTLIGWRALNNTSVATVDPLIPIVTMIPNDCKITNFFFYLFVCFLKITIIIS